MSLVLALVESDLEQMKMRGDWCETTLALVTRAGRWVMLGKGFRVERQSLRTAMLSWDRFTCLKF